MYMKILGTIIVNTLALMITATFVSGVSYDSYIALIVAAVVIGLLNTFIKPIVKILTFPITLMTLGIFAFILNAAFFALAAQLTDGFYVDGFVPALIGSLVLSIVSALLGIMNR